jgi:hypothetical protein
VVVGTQKYVVRTTTAATAVYEKCVQQRWGKKTPWKRISCLGTLCGEKAFRSKNEFGYGNGKEIVYKILKLDFVSK